MGLPWSDGESPDLDVPAAVTPLSELAWKQQIELNFHQIEAFILRTF